MTLIQAQERYITRVNSCHTGHIHRVQRAAAKQLRAWLNAHGTTDTEQQNRIIQDARDMAKLERETDE